MGQGGGKGEGGGGGNPLTEVRGEKAGEDGHDADPLVHLVGLAWERHQNRPGKDANPKGTVLHNTLNKEKSAFSGAGAVARWHHTRREALNVPRSEPTI